MADGSAIKGSEDAMQRCNELDTELAELRAAYEQYFMGNERLPPLKKHEGFKKQYMKLKSSFVRQTAAKFRIESIGQKLLTFERLWVRTLEQIESGTYKRDLMRLKRHQKQPQKRAHGDFDVDEDLDLSDLDEGSDDLASALAAAEAAASARAAAALAPQVKPVAPALVLASPPSGMKPAAPLSAWLKPLTPPLGLTPPIPPPKPAGPPKISAPLPTTANAALKQAGAARPLAPGGGESGLSDTKVKAIYDAYLMAKKRCGEDTRAVTYDSVANSLRKQVPELMKQHNAKTVEFKVVIKDGKAVLRALPKE